MQEASHRNGAAHTGKKSLPVSFEESSVRTGYSRMNRDGYFPENRYALLELFIRKIRSGNKTAVRQQAYRAAMPPGAAYGSYAPGATVLRDRVYIIKYPKGIYK